MNSSISRLYLGTFYDQYVIFPSDTDNRQILIDTETGLISIGTKLISSEKNGIKKETDYSAAIFIGEKKLAFIPKYQNEILLLDIDNGEQSLIEVGLPDILEEGAMRYWEYVLYQNTLFLFPFHADHILKIRLDTMSAENYANAIKEIDYFIGAKCENYFAAKVQYGRDCVFLAGWSQNIVMKLNLDSMEYQLYTVENESGEKGFRDIEIFENRIYIVNHQFHVFEYEMESFQLNRQLPLSGLYSLVKRIRCGLCLVPAFEDNYIIMDMNQNYIIKDVFNMEEYNLSFESTGNCNHHLIESNDYFFVMRMYGNTITSINKTTGEICSISLKYDKNVTQYILEDRETVWEDQPFENGFCLHIEDFINGIDNQHGEFFKNAAAGENIFNAIR